MKKKAIVLIALLLSVTLLLSACLPKTQNTKRKERVKQSEADSKILRVGYMRAPTLNPLIDIAEKKDYFKQNGVRIRKIRAQGAIQVLTKKKADVALLSLMPALSAFLDGKDVTFMAAVSDLNSMFYNTSRFAVSRLPEDQITSVKTVGIADLTKNERLLIKILLKEMGINDKLVEYKELLQETDRAAKLTGGTVDMVFIGSEKTRDTLKAKGNYTVSDARQVLKDFYMPSGIVSTQFALRKKPQALRAFVKAIYQAIKYSNENGGELLSLLENQYHLPKPVARFMYTNFIDSKAGQDYVPRGDPAKAASAIVSVTKPDDPQRNLSQFIFKDYAEEAVK